MEIVSSSLLMRRFRTIKEFQMDFGLSKTTESEKKGNKGPGQVIIKIKDPFIKRYSLEKNTFISKFGNIGTLLFYVDNSINGDDFFIYDEDKEYKIQYKESNNVRDFLSNILDKILSEELEPTNIVSNMEEEIVFEIDKNLPQGEFLDKLKEMKEKMSRMDINPYK